MLQFPSHRDWYNSVCLPHYRVTEVTPCLKKAYEKSYPYNCGLLLVLSLSYVVPPLICRKLLHTPFPVTSPAFYLINGIKSIDRYRNVITLKTARME